MKKLFSMIVVLGLLWCNVGFALTQQQLIDQHLSNRKLDLIEGVWQSKIIGYSGGEPQVLMYYKSGNIYKMYVLSNSRMSEHRINKSSETYYYGTGELIYPDGKTLSSRITINIDAYSGTSTSTDSRGTWSFRLNRIWPSDIRTHNAKFEEKKKPKKKKKYYDDKKLLEISSGTGFIISEDGYFVSNNHVVDICKEIKTKKSGQVYKVNIIATDKVNDLAIGKIDLSNSKHISLSEEGGVLGEDIIVSGFPLQGELSESVKITKGVVSSLSGPGNNYAIMQIDAAVQPGNSGGPILNQYAEIVGVTVAKADTEYFLEKSGTLPENINFGVKVETLQSFIKGNNIKLNKPKKGKSKTRTGSSSTSRVLSSSEISKLAEDSTIHLQCWNTMAAAAKLFQNSKVKNLLVDVE